MKKILSLFMAILIIAAISIHIYTTESEQVAPSSESEWWERFNSLSPEDQARVNFRPNRTVNENYPVETASID